MKMISALLLISSSPTLKTLVEYLSSFLLFSSSIPYQSPIIKEAALTTITTCRLSLVCLFGSFSLLSLFYFFFDPFSTKAPLICFLWSFSPSWAFPFSILFFFLFLLRLASLSLDVSLLTALLVLLSLCLFSSFFFVDFRQILHSFLVILLRWNEQCFFFRPHSFLEFKVFCFLFRFSFIVYRSLPFYRLVFFYNSFLWPVFRQLQIPFFLVLLSSLFLLLICSRELISKESWVCIFHSFNCMPLNLHSWNILCAVSHKISMVFIPEENKLSLMSPCCPISGWCMFVQLSSYHNLTTNPSSSIILSILLS